MGILAWAYQAIQPPPPKICGSLEGPPITAPRIKLRDGRYLAYKEQGVPKESAKYKIVSVHGFDSCRHDNIGKFLSPVLVFLFSLSILIPMDFGLLLKLGLCLIFQEIVEELGLYIVSFDRPGYGESDPNPKRTVKSMALDIEELADQLGLGSKFYVVGYSMGGQVLWSVLKYIPNRYDLLESSEYEFCVV